MIFEGPYFVNKNYYWIIILVVAIIVFLSSFLAPSKLLDYSVNTIIHFIQKGELIDYLSIYSLFFIPIIIGLIIFQKRFLANLLTTSFIISQLGFNYEISNILNFKLPVEYVVWIIGGAITLLLLFINLNKGSIKKSIKIILSILGAAFVLVNLFSLFIITPRNEIGILTIFIITFLIFNSSGRIRKEIYIPLYISLFLFMFFLLIENLNCNVEFISDYGIQNWGLGHLFQECGTYYLWLLTGFLLNISQIQRQKISKKILPNNSYAKP